MATRSYLDEFKIEAVRQVNDRDYKPKDVAERLGVTTKNIQNWITQFGADSNEQQRLTKLEAEIKRLKAENYRVTEERNILKEAAFFRISFSSIRTIRFASSRILSWSGVNGIALLMMP